KRDRSKIVPAVEAAASFLVLACPAQAPVYRSQDQLPRRNVFADLNRLRPGNPSPVRLGEEDCCREGATQMTDAANAGDGAHQLPAVAPIVRSVDVPKGDRVARQGVGERNGGEAVPSDLLGHPRFAAIRGADDGAATSDGDPLVCARKR